KMNLHATSPAVVAGDATESERESPENQFSIRSSLDLPPDVTFDTALRYVDHLNFPLQGVYVPSYFELDARLAWQINKHWEAAIVGQNLLHSSHQQFTPTAIQFQQATIPRSVYGRITLTF